MAGVEKLDNVKEVEETNGNDVSNVVKDDVTEESKSDYKTLRKIIDELISTEKTYVKDLHALVDQYLLPIQKNNKLQSDDVNEIFGNIEDIVAFQDEFSKALQEPMKLLKDVSPSNEEKIFKRVLFSIGSAFLYFAENFKVYSSFTATHIRSYRIFTTNQNPALKEILQEHQRSRSLSTSLDSYMIKPIQRIMKYPLFLRDLCHAINPDSDEHYHLTQTLNEVQRINRHINKMQEIYEEYGTMFDDLSKQYKKNKSHTHVVDLSIGELQEHGKVEWCNVGTIGLIHKDLILHTHIFIFRTAVVFSCRGRSKASHRSSEKRKSSQSSQQVMNDVLQGPPGHQTHQTPNHRTTHTPNEHPMVDVFQKVIPIQEVKIEDGEFEDSDQLHWWDLIHVNKNSKDGSPFSIFKLCCSSAEQKSGCISLIQKLARRLNIDINKKSTYVPFGGKRLTSLPTGSRPGLRKLSKRRDEKK